MLKGYLHKLRKLLIKILCMPIFPYALQKKIRQILIRGLFLSGIKTLYNLIVNHKKTKYYLTIAACCKDEGAYIQEWVEYYLLQGVEHFYLYNNNGTDNSKEILQSYIDNGLITWIDWPGAKQQVKIYEDVIKKHRNESRWMAIVDLDEFIVPLNSKNLSQNLKKYEKYNQIVINWTIYGSSGHMNKTEGLVIERFTQHARGLSNYPKAIINPKAVVQIDIHKHIVLGRTIEISRQLSPEIQINHYVIKSLEEYRLKKKRGDVLSYDDKFTDAFFKSHDLNEVEDINLMTSYAAKIKQNINKQKSLKEKI